MGIGVQFYRACLSIKCDGPLSNFFNVVMILMMHCPRDVTEVASILEEISIRTRI